MSEIFIHEVGLRDGLQMESRSVPLEKKLGWALQLIESRVAVVQVGSFVHPKRVPQMADTDDLVRRLIETSERRTTTISGLVLNEKGVERGLACGIELFCMGVSASETHSRKNTGMGTQEALERTISMARSALVEDKKVQVSVQSAFGCGYEGVIAPDRVIGLVQSYLDAGLTSISLADTAGHADPDAVSRLFDRLLNLGDRVEATCHFHNNYGMALANCYAAYRTGVRWFESAFGGLGGCPFTAVPGGNVCTEDLVHMFQRMGLAAGIDLETLVGLAKDAQQFFEKELPGSIYKSGSLDL